MIGQPGLAGRLRELRHAAGMSETEAGRRAGLTQVKISRLEHGRYAPVIEDVRALARIYGASRDTRRELETMARDLRAEVDTSRVVLRRGRAQQQARIGRLEASAASIRSFHPTLVIGLLQTPAYARAVFDTDTYPDDPEQAVNARMNRQGILESGRDFALVMTEGALRWQLGGPQLMADQLDRISVASQLDSVALGVIPWSRPAHVHPMHGFHIYDAHTVVVGTQTAMAVFHDRREVATYESLFGELEALADFDDDARGHLRRIASDYRSLL